MMTAIEVLGWYMLAWFVYALLVVVAGLVFLWWRRRKGP